jgi:hypothetical protein
LHATLPIATCALVATLLMKMFQGVGFDEYVRELRKRYAKVSDPQAGGLATAVLRGLPAGDRQALSRGNDCSERPRMGRGGRSQSGGGSPCGGSCSRRTGWPARCLQGESMNDLAKNLLLWVVIAVVLMAVFQSFSPRTTSCSSASSSSSCASCSPAAAAAGR